MKNKLLALWATIQEKIYDNKETLIRVGAAVAGTVVGVVAASIVANAQEQSLVEEYLMEEEEIEMETDSSQE